MLSPTQNQYWDTQKHCDKNYTVNVCCVTIASQQHSNCSPPLVFALAVRQRSACLTYSAFVTQHTVLIPRLRALSLGQRPRPREIVEAAAECPSIVVRPSPHCKRQRSCAQPTSVVRSQSTLSRALPLARVADDNTLLAVALTVAPS